MSERNDRSIERSWPVMPVLAVAVLFAFAILAAYWWYHRPSGQGPVVAEQRMPTEPSPVQPDEHLAITLYIPGLEALEPVATEIKRQPEPQIEAREAVAALLADERSGRSPLLQALRLRAVYLDISGTAYVDLSASAEREVRASAWDELLAVYAVVDTVTQNFPQIRLIRFLVNGREQSTLAGHVDLTRSFARRADLVAVP
jgi:hypothetical protein